MRMFLLQEVHSVLADCSRSHFSLFYLLTLQIATLQMARLFALWPLSSVAMSANVRRAKALWHCKIQPLSIPLSFVVHALSHRLATVCINCMRSIYRL